MNKSYKTSDTIFSNITAIFGSSVILVRISGEYEKIKEVYSKLKIKKELKAGSAFVSKIYDEKTVLDEALITFFKAPYSFTGEDVLEIALHGSRFIFNRLSEILLSMGLRFAENGEFSYRAFLNGKMDLVEAEGMASLIASETELQHKVSMRQFKGENTNRFESLKSSILDVLGSTESLIDFSDEELPEELTNVLEKKVFEVKKEIETILQNSSAISLQEGLKLVIIGRPNAGKSSIFNKIIGREKAIVSEIAGTTRDVLEERIILKGVPLFLYDTAGIRSETSEIIEMEGIKRAKNILSKSDLKLLVKDVNSPENFEELAEDLGFKIDENTLLINNKIDLQKPDKSFGINLSAITGEGFEELIKTLESLIEKNFLSLISSSLVSSERQKILLKEALLSLQMFDLSKEIELGSEDLRRAAKSLNSIIGSIDTEDILGNIFSKFCIGK